MIGYKAVHRGRKRSHYSSDKLILANCFPNDNVYALDAQTGTEQWCSKTNGGVWSSPAVVDGTVYVGSSNYNIYALDARLGTKR